LCTSTVPTEHRPEESTNKWFEAEGVTRWLERGEEDEKGGKDKNTVAMTCRRKYPNNH